MTTMDTWLEPGHVWQTRLPDGWSLLAGNRRGRWHYDLLDLAGHAVRSLDGCRGGTLDYNVHADTRVSASFTWTGLPADEPDWNTSRVRVRYTDTFDDGSTVDWHMLTGIPATSPADIGVGGLATVEVDVYDRTLALREATVTQSFAVPQGTPVIPTVIALAEGVDGATVAIDDNGATTRTGAVWPPGTTTLRIINDLLSTANYFALWADGAGVLRSSAYVEPMARSLEWAFVPGITALHSGRWRRTRDTFAVPNRVLVMTRGTDDVPGLVATATLDELVPDHPLSYAVRGRWVDRVEVVDATDQDTLYAQAVRLVRESLQVAETIDIRHAPMPLDVNGRIEFAGGPYVIEKLAITCDASSLWRTTARRVVA